MKTYRLLLWGLALLAVALSSRAEAFEYFVATTGSNAVSCTTARTIGTPKQTLANANDCLTAPGDILSIRAGTYSENIRDGFGTGTDLEAGAITIRRYPGDGAVIWKSTGNQGMADPADRRALYLRAQTSRYLIFEGITFDGNAKIGDTVSVTGGWGPEGAHHIRFLNCEFRNSFSEISISHSHHNEWIGGSIHDNNDNTGFRHGIYFSSESDDNLVEGMDVYNNLGYGIHVWTGTTALANRNIFRDNNVHHNGTATGQCGIVYSGGADGQIYNNRVWANGGGGICANHGGGSATGILIAHNSVYGNQGNSGFYGIYTPGNSAVVRNNISYNNGGLGNVSYGSSTQSNNITTNPLFVNVGTGDFHLQAGSPAIDAGTTTSVTGITTDADGTTWSVPREAGAYDKSGVVVLPNVIVFTQPPGSQIVGTPLPTVQACVNDSAGVRQTAYATNIGFTLSNDANPTTILTGGTAGAPTAGCKTATLTLDKTGTGFKVKATTGALEVESGPFNSLALALPPSVLRLIRVPAPTP